MRKEMEGCGRRDERCEKGDGGSGGTMRLRGCGEGERRCAQGGYRGGFN